MSASERQQDLTLLSDDELAEERDFLIASLADLEAERDAGDIDDHDYETLKDGYTARAAAVLRLLDRRRVDAELDSRSPDEPVEADDQGAPATSASPVRHRAGTTPVARPARSDRTVDRTATGRPRWRTPVIVVGVALFAVAAGLGVARAMGQRLPGETITGTTPAEKLANQVNDAATKANDGDLVDALKELNSVLVADPKNAGALSAEGWILGVSGMQGKNSQLLTQGLNDILQAEQYDSTEPMEHFYAGELYYRGENDPRDAVTQLEAAEADNPSSDMQPEIQGELQDAQAALAGVPAPNESVGPTTTTTP